MKGALEDVEDKGTINVHVYSKNCWALASVEAVDLFARNSIGKAVRRQAICTRAEG